MGNIRSCPIAGCTGEPTTLAVGQLRPRGLAIDEAHAYWLTGVPAEPSGGPGQILQCSLGGSGASPTVLGADQPTPTALAIDTSFVYWTNQGEARQDPYRQVYLDGSVNRAPIAAP